MNEVDGVVAMRKWAFDNYEDGAHWIVECWADGDYLEVLSEAGTVEAAIAEMESYVDLMVAREMDCRYE